MTVTALGGAGKTAKAIAGAIVDYLEGRRNGDEVEQAGRLLRNPDMAMPAAGGVVRYHADSVEGPGAWLGRGAQRLSLTGVIDPEHLQRVLEGRDPHTGERLISARGNAGRTGLKVGTEAAIAADGEPLYSLSDAVAHLGIPMEVVTSLVEAGNEGFEFSSKLDDLTYLVAITDEDGNQFIPESELERYETARLAASLVDEIASEGFDNDEFTLKEMGARIGVSTRYLRECAEHWHDPEHATHAALAAGEEPKQNWLVTTKKMTSGKRKDGTILPARERHVVTRAEMVEFLKRRKQPATRIGFDMTFTFEKSVSVAALLSEGNTQDVFVEAIDAGNAEMIAYLEEHACFTRTTRTIENADGTKTKVTERVRTEGLVVGSYLHGTSRALDPFLHKHNVAANCAIDKAGNRKALDARAFYRHSKAAGAIADAEMRYRISKELGCRWVRTPRGTTEIAGIPPAVIEEFSTRQGQIQAELEELANEFGMDATAKMRDIASANTRTKKIPSTRDELLDGWRKRAAAHGLTAETLAACFSAEPMVFDRLDVEMEARLAVWLAGPEGLTADTSTFGRIDVIRKITEFTVDGQVVIIPPAEVLRLADRFLANDQVVELDAGGLDTLDSTDLIALANGTRLDNTFDEPVFSTRSMLLTQRRLMSRFAMDNPDDLGRVADDVIETAIVDAATLSDEQSDFVRSFCGSGRRFQAGVGRPGTGKTFTMAVCASAWQTAGYRVLGTSASAQATAVLAEQANIDAETVAMLRTQWEETGNNPLDARTVLIVDESSTIGDRDLSLLLRMAIDAGAVVRFLGDPLQHGSVGAGGTFRRWCQDPSTPELTNTRRLKNAHDLDAANALRTGDVDRAIAEWAAAGHLITGKNDQVLRALITGWLEDHQAGKRRPIVVTANATRRDINAAVQQLRSNLDELGDVEVVGDQDRRYRAGDHVVCCVGNRELFGGSPTNWLRNGTSGVITEIVKGDTPDQDRITVDWVGVGTLTTTRSFWDAHETASGAWLPGIDLAYAITDHKIQGDTIEGRGQSVALPGATRAATYVQQTRATTANELYLLSVDDTTTDLHLPRLPETDPLDALRASLDVDGSERTANEIDPHAAPAAWIRAGRTPHELTVLRQELAAHVASHEGNDDPWAAAVATLEDQELATVLNNYGPSVLSRAETLAINAIDRTARTDVDPDIAAMLPKRPETPWIAHQWDNAVAAIAVHNALWATTPKPGHAWGHLLGADDNSSPARQIDRNKAIHAVTRLCEQLVGRALENTPLPDVFEDRPLHELDATTTATEVAAARDTAAQAHEWAEQAAANLQTAIAQRDATTAHVEQLEDARRRGHAVRGQLADARQALSAATASVAHCIAENNRYQAHRLETQRAFSLAKSGTSISPESAAREATIRWRTRRNIPAWATQLLAETRAHSTHLDPDAYASAIGDVTIWQERRNDHDTVTPLGSPPRHGAQEAEWLRLVHRIATSLGVDGAALARHWRATERDHALAQLDQDQQPAAEPKIDRERHNAGIAALRATLEEQRRQQQRP